MNLAKITLPKSLVASVGVHALIVALSMASYFFVPKGSLELTGFDGGVRGNGKPVTVTSFNLITKASKAPVSKKIMTKADNVISKVVLDEVSELASAVSSDAPLGDGTGTGFGSGTGSGTGEGNAENAALYASVKSFFTGRLGSNLKIREDQLIKLKLVMNMSGDVLSVELIEGTLEMINLRKILAVAKNVPIKSYWKSTSAIPGELIIPLFLTTND